ncbi:hypothetical protein L9F63_011985, partial [Diploptera punctata]
VIAVRESNLGLAPINLILLKVFPPAFFIHLAYNFRLEKKFVDTNRNRFFHFPTVDGCNATLNSRFARLAASRSLAYVITHAAI